MNVNIGKAILKRLNSTGMSKSEFARRINKSPQNVQDIFTRTSIDTYLLESISRVLEFNFFVLFINEQAIPVNKEINQINEKLNFISNRVEILIEQTVIKNSQKETKHKATSKNSRKVRSKKIRNSNP